MSERKTDRLDASEYLVKPGREVDLKKRPTRVTIYESKEPTRLCATRIFAS